MSASVVPAPTWQARESQRLGATLTLSVLVHALLLLGVGFAVSDSAPLVPTLDVIFSQTQTAQLVASYHQSLLVSAAPRLDTTSASQNYLYNKVEDSSSTEAHLAYDNGEAIRATVTQAASRSLHTLRVENNQVTGNSTSAPGPQSRHTDLLPLLKQLQLQRQQDGPLVTSSQQLRAGRSQGGRQLERQLAVVAGTAEIDHQSLQLD